MYSVDELILYT